MKDSVETLSSSLDFAQYANMALWKFGLMGMIVTLIIQSSSATSVLTFTALAS
jgi:Na+/phosphate symporter